MNKIKDLIYQHIKKYGRASSSDLMQKFDVSRQAIHRHLLSLIKDGKILRQGTSRSNTFYISNDSKSKAKLFGKLRHYKKRVLAKNLSEDTLFNEIRSQRGFFDGVEDNDIKNLHYAFTEMVNNSIDHSGSRFIDVELSINGNVVSFHVSDKGIGIFENIRSKKFLSSEMDSIQDLLKGKITTADKYHSGEGIFFTSKVADRFAIRSHKKKVTIDNKINDVFVEDSRFLKGTHVFFELYLPSKKILMDIFNEYTHENFIFDKSKIKVKLFNTGENYVSRSQAKRLLHSLDKFKSVVLDFSGVTTIGQAFADEIFRVFKNSHPDIDISWENAGENVEFMIRRALP